LELAIESIIEEYFDDPNSVEEIVGKMKEFSELAWGDAHL
jgi:hypothetical protein